jgi:hypothetical protein
VRLRPCDAARLANPPSPTSFAASRHVLVRPRRTAMVYARRPAHHAAVPGGRPRGNAGSPSARRGGSSVTAFGRAGSTAAGPPTRTRTTTPFRGKEYAQAGPVRRVRGVRAARGVHLRIEGMDCHERSPPERPAPLPGLKGSPRRRTSGCGSVMMPRA